MKRKMKVNRRSVMKTIGALGITSTFISKKTFGQGINKKATAFALIGDDDHHFDTIKTALDATIVKGINITIDYSNDTTQLNASTLDGYRLLITALGNIMDLTVPIEKDVQAFIQNGGAALFLNNSTDIATDTFIMRDIIGGHWLQHSGVLAHSKAIRPYRVRITNRNHPITKGVKNDFEITGMHHYNQYDKDPRYVFMTSDTIDGWSYNNMVGDKHYDERLGSRVFGPSCPSGWAYDYGKGRVCFMTPGHTLDEYMNPEFVKLQKNAVRWCLKKI
jgi:type 1 glutamine amidotransferase